MPLPVVYTEIRGQNTEAELYLNDIPIDLVGRDRQPFHATRVHEYLVHGRNHVEIVGAVGPSPSQSREGGHSLTSPDSRGSFRLAAYYSEREIVGEGGQELLRIEWGASAGRLHGSVTLGLPYGGWSWETADVLRLDGATVREVQSVVDTVHRAFVERNPDILLEYSRIRLTELSRCYDPPSADYWLSSFRSGVLNRSDSSDWSVVPLEDQQPDYRLCADGRMVDCVNTNWQSLIRTEYRGATLTDFRMYLGRIHGVWHVLR